MDAAQYTRRPEECSTSCDEMRNELPARCKARPRLKRDFDLFGRFMMGAGSRHAQKALKFYALSKSQETEPLRRCPRTRMGLQL